MIRVHDLSIRNKLTLMILSSTFFVLALSNGAFIFFEIQNFDAQIRNKLTPLAAVLGFQSGVYLIFNEPMGIDKDLSSLSAQPDIAAAFIYDSNNKLFASYPEQGQEPDGITQFRIRLGLNALANLPEQGILLTDGGESHFLKPIILNHEHLGTIHLVDDRRALRRELHYQLLLSVTIVGISLIFAIFLSVRLPRVISDPILLLKEQMKRVTSAKDYTIRAQKLGNDEIGDLVTGFNEMLGEVETRDQALERYSRELEKQVITRTKELAGAKDAAEAANRSKSMFLASMSHELRTPLNGILGYAHLLQRDYPMDERQREALEIIQRSGKHLLTLIDDILDLSKLEVNKIQLQPAPLALKSFLDSITGLFKIQAQNKRILFQIKVDKHVPKAIEADEKRLRQVLFNLLSNAIKFTHHGSVIFTVKSIQADTDKHQVRLFFEVEDSGIGIPFEQREKIFEPFEQTDVGARYTEGAGLGLAICHQLVHLMGGTLLFESTPGEGSRFWFHTPFEKVTYDLPEPTFNQHTIRGYQGSRKRILVVDDNHENRHVLIDILEPMGFLLTQAASGQQALDRIDADCPDLILLDIYMDEMDGIETLTAIHQRPQWRALPAVAISAGMMDEEKLLDLQEGGFAYFIPKPISTSVLFDVVAKLLGIEWIYDTLQIESGTQSQLTPPPIAELDYLYDLAELGKCQRIREWAEQHDQQHSDHQAFAQHVKQLAIELKDQAIRALIERHRTHSDQTNYSEQST